MATSDNAPRTSTTSLEPIRGDTFVVQVGLLYNHYTIRPDDRYTNKPIFTLKKRPPVLREGIAIINRKFYHVPLQDILRGVVRKSREIKQVANEQSITSTPDVSVSNKQGAGDPPTEEERSNADLAWEEQVGTLFQILHSQEGEFLVGETSVQPGFGPEIRPVSD